MFYGMVFHPQLDAESSRIIDAIRREYDPTWGVVALHQTLIFPTPERIGHERLVGHIQTVLAGWKPFAIRLGGFQKSPDHWLFLGVQQGEAEVKRLYLALNSGIMEEYRGDITRFVAHLGLGLFVKEGVSYDRHKRQESEFDQRRYDEALGKAQALPAFPQISVERLLLITIPDAVIEWFNGRRQRIPEGSKVEPVQEFRLGQKEV